MLPTIQLVKSLKLPNMQQNDDFAKFMDNYQKGLAKMDKENKLKNTLTNIAKWLGWVVVIIQNIINALN